MKKALLMTVGTGIGKSRVRSLASGLVVSIEHNNPNKIVFFVTEKSAGTVLEIEKLMNGDVPEHEKSFIDRPDEWWSVKDVVAERIRMLKRDGWRVYVDITSGTKAMSAGAAIAAWDELASVSYVSGERGENNLVSRGREKVVTKSPVKSFVESNKRLFKRFFNRRMFQPGLILLDRIEESTGDKEILEEVERSRALANGYMAWDLFDHERAFECLRSIAWDGADISGNKKFLGRITSEDPNKAKKVWHCRIADMLNNASRRVEEGKHDDAVARLYRTIELIGQYILHTQGIDTSDVDAERLKELGLCETAMAEIADYRGKKIQIPLRKSFELIRLMKGEGVPPEITAIGTAFHNDRKLKDLLNKRNMSILAHGTTPVSKDTAEKMFAAVKKYAEMAVPDLQMLMAEAQFPKIAMEKRN